MTLNTEPFALIDLFSHVVAGRANLSEIEVLIKWLQEQKERIEEEDKREAFKQATRSTYGINLRKRPQNDYPK